MVLAESLAKENCIDPLLRPPTSVGQMCSLPWWKDPFLPYQGTLPSSHTRALTFALISLLGSVLLRKTAKEYTAFNPPPPPIHTRSCSAFTLHFIRSPIEPMGMEREQGGPGSLPASVSQVLRLAPQSSSLRLGRGRALLGCECPRAPNECLWGRRPSRITGTSR